MGLHLFEALAVCEGYLQGVSSFRTGKELPKRVKRTGNSQHLISRPAKREVISERTLLFAI
jgi:hypothetical protein